MISLHWFPVTGLPKIGLTKVNMIGLVLPIVPVLREQVRPIILLLMRFMSSMVNLVTRRLAVKKLWAFQSGGIIVGIHKNKIPIINKLLLLVLLKNLENNQASVLAATTCNVGNVSNDSAFVSSSSWIIDYGAIGHMTCDYRQFHLLEPSTKTNVSIANGTPNPVTAY